MNHNFLIWIYATTCVVSISNGLNWNENFNPRLRVNYLNQKSDDVQSFLGNQTHVDHFKLLKVDGDSILIGARNVIYNLSLTDLKENVEQRITWTSPDRDREMCLVKGKSEDECQNYIRVLAITDTSNLLVCGTNSFNPKCRTYTTVPPTHPQNATKMVKTPKSSEIVHAEYRLHHEFSGRGYCPHDPKHNSTAIFVGGELYSGTVADFSGTDALIFRDNLRTEQYDLKHLNAPDFVSSVEDENHVYFFFRESAVEYINCGKSIYSRVARVCKNDRGGPHKFQHRWTTFLKARLNCSIPGDIPFYFNEIHSTTDFISVGETEKIIYGVFTTPENSIAGSAICSFRLSDIRHAFDEGPFKGQATGNSNWLPIRVEDLYGLDSSKTRPGQCVNDSTSLPESNLNFIKSHSLMDEAVPNAKLRMGSPQPEGVTDYDYGEPLFVKTSLDERLTVIGVDHQVRTPSGTFYDILYVGSTKGKVYKVVSAIKDSESKKRNAERKPVVVEDIQVFPPHVAVRNLQVIKDTSESKIVALSDFEVKSLPLHRCSAAQVQTCSGCVALQDPHCAWNFQTEKCVDSSTFASTDEVLLIQDVFNGKHMACSNEKEVFRSSSLVDSSDVGILSTSTPTKVIDIMIDIEDDGDNIVPTYDLPVVKEPETMYAGTSFITSIIATALACLVLGFGSGWFASRKISKDDYRSCGHRYLESQHLKNHESCPINESSYAPGPCTKFNDAKNNLLSRNLDKPLSKVTPELNEKNNLNNSLLTTSTTASIAPSIENELVADTSLIKCPTDTTVQYNGTIPRNNGTLCKKVYL